MSNKIWLLSDQNIFEIRTQYPITSGTTLVRQNHFPNEFINIGINKRDPKSNEFKGTIITKPSDNELVFGFVYEDKKENQPNEDIYSIDLINKVIKHYPKGNYERVNPQYKGTHKGLKDFLKPQQ